LQYGVVCLNTFAITAVEEHKCLNSELWHACAGPLVSLPAVGSRVVYFPQGHSEQVREISTQHKIRTALAVSLRNSNITLFFQNSKNSPFFTQVLGEFPLQVAASTNKEMESQIPNYPNLPPQLICQLHNVTMHVSV
jgi:hypothetical protein